MNKTLRILAIDDNPQDVKEHMYAPLKTSLAKKMLI